MVWEWALSSPLLLTPGLFLITPKTEISKIKIRATIFHVQQQIQTTDFFFFWLILGFWLWFCSSCRNHRTLFLSHKCRYPVLVKFSDVLGDFFLLSTCTVNLLINWLSHNSFCIFYMLAIPAHLSFSRPLLTEALFWGLYIFSRLNSNILFKEEILPRYKGGLTLHNSRQFSGYSLSYFCIRHLATSPELNPAMSHMWKCSVCSLEFSPSPSLSVIPRPRPISDLTVECLAYIAAQQENSLPALTERAICLPWGHRRTDSLVESWLVGKRPYLSGV